MEAELSVFRSAHKIVLAAASPNLKQKLLTTDTLYLPDICREEVQSILEDLYKGSQRSAKRLENLVCVSKNTVSRTWKRELEQSSDFNSAKKQKTTGPVYLNYLPNEIICHILSYLPTTDILQKVACVSQQFWDLANHPSVHKVVRVGLNSNPSFFNFLMKANQMKELHVDTKEVGKCIDGILLFIASHTQLRVFCLNHPINVTKETFEYLEHSKWWSKLGQIDMKLESLSQAVAHITGTGNMTHCKFDFIYNSNLTGSKYRKLKSLTFEEDFKDFAAIKDIIMSGKDSLEEINIMTKEDHSLYQDFEYLSEVTNLTSLEINPGFSSFKLLPKLTKLENLSLYHLANGSPYFFDDGFNIQQNSLPSLKFLSLIYWPFIDWDDDDDKDVQKVIHTIFYSLKNVYCGLRVLLL